MSAPEAPPAAVLEPVRLRTTATAGRFRWAIALGATVLMLAGAVGLAAVAGAGNAASPTLSYVPAEAIAYVEVRLDLPGDQLDQATRLLTRLPGLLDGANLDWKVERAVDGALGNATGGRLSWSSDVGPWFSGPAAAVLLPGSDASPRAGALVAVKDRARAEEFVQSALEDARAEGGSVSTFSVRGMPGWTIAGPDGRGMAVALTDDMLIVAADPADIEPFLDARSGEIPGLASDPAWREAFAGAPAERIGTAFVRGEAMASTLVPAGLVEGAKPPEWIFATLQVQPDGLLLDGWAAAMPGVTPSPLHESRIAAGVPADAVLYAEVHDADDAIETVLGVLRESPDVAAQLGQLDQLEPFLGVSVDRFFDFVADAALVVLPPPAAGLDAMPGIVASLADEPAAAARLTRLRALIALGGSQFGARVSTEAYGSATIATLSFDAPAGEGATPALPVRSISWALGNGRLVVGLTPAFVKAVLDTPAGRGLGDDPDFRDALARAGGPATAGFAWADVPGAVGLAGSLAGSASGAPDLSAAEPYLEAAESLVAVRGWDGDHPTVRAVLDVSPPSR